MSSSVLYILLYLLLLQRDLSVDPRGWELVYSRLWVLSCIRDELGPWSSQMASDLDNLDRSILVVPLFSKTNLVHTNL